MLRIVFLLIGVGLFAAIIAATDVEAALALIGQMGWGLAWVTAAYGLVSFGDALSWHVLMHQIPLTWWRFLSLWWIRLVGEAFNYVLPAGGMGGEPVKAVMLKRRSGMDYQEITASLFAAKTTNVITLVLFLLGGFLLMQEETRVSGDYRLAAGIGLGCLAAGIAGFFLLQRFGVSSALAGRVVRKRDGRLARAVEIVAQVEQRLYSHYRERKGRFAASLVIALVVWVVSVVEVYLALYFLGHPVSWAEAWIIESGAQLVRAGTFFIPANLGALDGAFVLLCSLFTGSPVVGVAVALVRRFREILWVAFGLAAGFFSRGGGEDLRGGKR